MILLLRHEIPPSFFEEDYENEIEAWLLELYIEKVFERRGIEPRFNSDSSYLPKISVSYNPRIDSFNIQANHVVFSCLEDTAFRLICNYTPASKLNAGFLVGVKTPLTFYSSKTF